MDMDMDMDMDVDMDMDMDIDVYHRPNLERACNVGCRLLLNILFYGKVICKIYWVRIDSEGNKLGLESIGWN